MLQNAAPVNMECLSAACTRDFEVFELLFDQYQEELTQENLDDLLMKSAHDWRRDHVSFLVDHGANVNGADSNGLTVLMEIVDPPIMNTKPGKNKPTYDDGIDFLEWFLNTYEDVDVNAVKRRNGWDDDVTAFDIANRLWKDGAYVLRDFKAASVEELIKKGYFVPEDVKIQEKV